MAYMGPLSEVVGREGGRDRGREYTPGALCLLGLDGWGVYGFMGSQFWGEFKA